MTVISQLLLQENMGLKVLVTVSSESIGDYLFHSQNQGVVGFCTLCLQQELGLIGTKLFFATWKGSFVSAEQRRALSPNLTCAHLWKCGTRGPGPQWAQITYLWITVSLLPYGRLSSMMLGSIMSNNRSVACRNTHSACFK